MPEEPVRYKNEKKNFQYFTIDGYTVIAWKHPTEEKKDLGGKLSPEGVSGQYATEQKSEWDGYIHHKDIGLKPLDSWKREIASTLSHGTDSPVSPANINLYASGITPEKLAKCPNCAKPLFVAVGGVCMSCSFKVL